MDKNLAGEQTNDANEDENDEDNDAIPQKMDAKQRVTVRNLRIREDTAKYLHNLAEDSAYYDPKSRSLRSNPFEKTGVEFEK